MCCFPVCKAVWDTSVLRQSFLSCCCWLPSGPGPPSLFLLFPLLGPVIVGGTVVIKPHDQVNLGSKGFVWFTLRHHCSSSKEIGRNLEAGADDAVEGCCLLACSVCFFMGFRTTSPGMAPSVTGWFLSHESLIKKVLYRLAYSPVLHRHFLI